MKKHNPIVITSNDKFRQMANKEGWKGNGTVGNPYIIENLEIDGAGCKTSYSCINIADTDVYFVITNCVLVNGGRKTRVEHNFGCGICLNNVHHGVLAHNLCVNNRSHGIYIYGDSSHNILIHNICRSNIVGISFHQTRHNTVMHNICIKNEDEGIDIQASTNNIVNNNLCMKNGMHGINIYGFVANTIMYNACIKNNGGCININVTQPNVIINNICIPTTIDVPKRDIRFI